MGWLNPGNRRADGRNLLLHRCHQCFGPGFLTHQFAQKQDGLGDRLQADRRGHQEDGQPGVAQLLHNGLVRPTGDDDQIRLQADQQLRVGGEAIRHQGCSGRDVADSGIGRQGCHADQALRFEQRKQDFVGGDGDAGNAGRRRIQCDRPAGCIDDRARPFAALGMGHARGSRSDCRDEEGKNK